MDKNGCPLVMIEWMDSAQPQSCWKFLADVGTPDSIHCVSVGWLVADGEENKSVVPNMGNINDPDSIQVSGVVTIPVCSIVKITMLQEPTLGGNIWKPGADEKDEVASKLIETRAWAEARRIAAQRETERRHRRRLGDPY